MEVVDDEGVKDIIREELLRLGIHGSPLADNKRVGYGAKFLNKTVQGGISKSGKKKKQQTADYNRVISPLPDVKIEGSKKSAPKSPFTSSKNRSSGKKNKQQQQQQQQMLLDAKVFMLVMCLISFIN